MRRNVSGPPAVITAALLSVLLLGCNKNRPPTVPGLAGPGTGYTHVAVNITVQATDPDNDAIAYQLQWSDSGDTTWTDFNASGQPVTQSRTYTSPGVFTAKTRAKDIKGLQSGWSSLLQTVISSQSPSTPSTPSGPTSGRVNVAYDFSTSTTDPDGDSVAYQFDWGDGGAPAWTLYYPSGQTVTQSHSFTASGTFTIKVKAKDKHGIESGLSPSLTITITANRAPNTASTPSGPASGYVNTSYTFSSSASDPDGDNVAIRFDWGDGVTSDWSNYVAGGTPVSMTHAYAAAGTYYIKAQAKDVSGESSAWSAPHAISITPPGGWVTIMSEDFQGVFPGTAWMVAGSPTWDDVNYRSYQGGWSGWCAGSTRHPSQNYAPNMNAWMVYGPFSLVGASDAYVSFYSWVVTEAGRDSLKWGASIDGTWFYCRGSVSGSYPSWCYDELELGDLCGRSQVWIAFWFKSDYSIEREGAYLDNIILKKYVGFGDSGRRPVQQDDAQPAFGQSIEGERVIIPRGGQEK